VSPEHRVFLAGAVVLAALACHEPGAPPLATGGPPAPRPTLSPAYRPSGHMAAGDVFVQLFEWPWPDVANECEQVLGPAGYAAVQVSPPEEHSLVPGFPWSERYQPVSYRLARSRSGDSAQFVDMVSRCKAAGVGIYVDAVINHMTNSPSPGVGSAGTAYSKYVYPGLYDSTDFHWPACTVTGYNNAANVQDCELLGLPDLDTENPAVRDSIAAYLIKLARLGVAGFRIDAAKHIQQVSLDGILRLVDSTMAAEGRPLPYYFLEVIRGAGEALSPYDYYGEAYNSGGAADITEMPFQNAGFYFGSGGVHVSQLNPNGPPGSQFSAAAWGLMPADKAVVFLENHDSQHDVGRVSYRYPKRYRLANVWMLAQPYGYPKILSSYSFALPAENDMGPPSDGNGWTLTPLTCDTTWATTWDGRDDAFLCQHRDPYILHMVRFRKIVAGTDQNHWWDDGWDAIAFSRGAMGFVAINVEDTAIAATVGTGMAPGSYCDVIPGGLAAGGTACAGDTVVVDSARTIRLDMPPLSAVAIDTATRMEP
jgi:alpha-amylase